MATTKRTAESMRRNFLSVPGDKYIISICSNCISSGMSFRVVNGEENFSISCDNKLAVWKMLLQLDNMGGREVFVQVDDGDLIPYKQSMPYKARF